MANEDIKVGDVLIRRSVNKRTLKPGDTDGKPAKITKATPKFLWVRQDKYHRETLVAVTRKHDTPDFKVWLEKREPN